MAFEAQCKDATGKDNTQATTIVQAGSRHDRKRNMRARVGSKTVCIRLHCRRECHRFRELPVHTHDPSISLG